MVRGPIDLQSFSALVSRLASNRLIRKIMFLSFKSNDGNICPNAPHDYTRYEHLITTMKLKQLDVYFVHETWLEGDVFDKIINGYLIFCHREIGNHNFRGVAIILLP